MAHRLDSPPPGDTMRILVATDNHLGFLASDPARGDDSFDTMDEILQTARDKHCDCVFLSGDLFHHNKPSRRTMFKTQQTFRKHVFGSGPVTIQVTSDQRANFGGRVVNYEDPSLSVQLPIFIIHGNHDDPTREGISEPLSAIDILAEAGLVNYFGRTDKADDIKIRPVLIEKGPVKVALYGLGWVRDERLHRTFAEKKVSFTKVGDDDTENWFNVMLIHQNRAHKGRGEKNCVAESMIPNFMDFVIWGHEHECEIAPQEKGTFFVSQPGSSIAVSLVEGESRPKHIGVLEVKKQENDLVSRMIPIPLRTVRPFLLDTSVELSEEESLKGSMPEMEKEEAIKAFLTQRVNDLLDEHAKTIKLPPPDDDPSALRDHKRRSLPIVRLKVEHTGFPTINIQRFGAQFLYRVANPGEILAFWKKKKLPVGMANTKSADDELPDEVDGLNDDASDGEMQDTPQERIQRIAEQILRESKNGLEFFTDQKLHLAVEEFVVKESTSAIQDIIEDMLENTQKKLIKERQSTAVGVSEDEMKAFISTAMERDRTREAAERKKAETKADLEQIEKIAPALPSHKSDPEIQTDESDAEEQKRITTRAVTKKTASSNGSKRSSPISKQPGRQTKRARQQLSSDDEIEDEQAWAVEERVAVNKRGAKKTAATARPVAVKKNTAAKSSTTVTNKKKTPLSSDSEDESMGGTLLSQSNYKRRGK